MSELVKELKDRDELIKQMSELMKELRDQAELTKQISELVGELKDRASLPRRSETLPGERKPTGCFKCGDPGHFKRECSLLRGNPDPSRGQGRQTKPTDQEGQRRGVRIRPPLAEPTDQKGQMRGVRIRPPLAEPKGQIVQRGRVRIRPPLGGDYEGHRHDSVMTPKRLPVRQGVETSRESGCSGRGFDQSYPPAWADHGRAPSRLGSRMQRIRTRG